MNIPVPAEIENQARQILVTCGWYPRANDEDAWPLSTAAVVQILTAAGYRIDCDKLYDFQARGISDVPDPWTAADVIGLANMLEARRDWLPGFHDAKKTPWQVRLEHCRAAGQIQAVADDFKRLDLKHSLVLMTEATNQQQREQLFVIIQALLEQQGVIV